MDEAERNLANQLESFCISSTEERIANELANTHISTRSMFGNATPHSSYTSPAPPPTTTTATTTTAAEPKKSEGEGWGDKGEEGWGDGPPSYTSLIQGTYFGFNSIMEAPQEVTRESSTTNQTQAFSQYKNKQATFSSALHDLDKK